MAISTDNLLAFVIETSYQGKALGLHWKLEQRVPKPCRAKQEDEVYNRVKKHLSELGLKTGFDYRIRYWGTPVGAEEYLNFQQLELI